MTRQKHLLVTISDDTENLFGVRFARSLFSELASHRITLFHISRTEKNTLASSLTEMWENNDRDDAPILNPRAQRSIEKAKKLLCESSMSVEQILIKTAAERYGKVRDILTEGAKGCYDAVVLGRRASYTLQWIFERPAHEIPHSMLRDSACTVPLWICPECDSTRRNVLICVDGSACSYRAVDHAGYILASEHQHKITLFHVVTRPSQDHEKFFHEAEKILHSHHISADRIRRLTVWGISVPGAIRAEGEKGGYAAVVLGMHGRDAEAHNSTAFPADGTLAKLMNTIEKTAIWCCP